MDAERERWRDVAEEFGLFFADRGLARSLGRVLGWLLVCDPPEQSAEELMAGLESSRGGISMAVRQLETTGAVERVSIRGSRRIHYRLRPGFWLREADSKAADAAAARKLAEVALTAVADRDESARSRAEEMRDMYAFLEEEYSRIRAAWNEREQRRGEERS